MYTSEVDRGPKALAPRLFSEGRSGFELLSVLDAVCCEQGSALFDFRNVEGHKKACPKHPDQPTFPVQ